MTVAERCCISVRLADRTRWSMGIGTVGKGIETGPAAGPG